MTNVLIAFYSRNGSVEALAKAVAEGAGDTGGDVRLRRAREVVSAEQMARAPGWLESAERMNSQYEAPTEDDAIWADAIALGSPSRFGVICSELKAYIDSLGGLWFQGRLAGKAGGGFSSTGSMHGGNEATILTMYNCLVHLGLIIVPLGYVDEVMFRAGTPYGASSVAYMREQRPPTEAELAVARFQGRRLALVGAALKSAGLTARADTTEA